MADFVAYARKIFRALAVALLIAAGTPGASAGTVVGKIVLPTSNVGLINGTLTFTLSQAAQVPGSFTIVPLSVTCATSADGSVVGLPNPTAIPSVQALPGSGTLPAGTYFIQLSYAGAGGETLPSPEVVVTLSSPGSIVVHPPVVQPPAATSWKIYIGSASRAETLQGSTGFASNWGQSVPLSSGGAVPPGTNTSDCTLVFNDATIPAPTYYRVTLTDAEQNLVAGYPQSWYLSGSIVDVSQIVPLATNPAILFPSPILANPVTAQPQSLRSALDLNQYPIENTSNLGPGIASGVWSGTLPAPNVTLGSWTPNTNVQLRRISLFAQNPGAGGSLGTTIQISDGANTCIFSNLLPGAANSSSTTASGLCAFNAGVALTVNLTGDDHTTRPGNISWNVEMTGR